MVAPVQAAGLPVPTLVTLSSPYRFVILPLVDHVLELVVRHWWENVLHHQRAQLLKLLLLVKGNQGIIVLNIPGTCRGRIQFYRMNSESSHIIRPGS